MNLGVLIVATIMGATFVAWALISSGGRRLGFTVFSLLQFIVVVVGAWNVKGDVGNDTFLRGSVVILASIVGMYLAALWSWSDRKVLRQGFAALVPPTASQLMVVRVLVVVSILAGVLYYYLSGSVPLVDFLRSIASGERASLDALRVRIYTVGSERGEVSYFGQGYLRQFFGNILPWAALVLLLEDSRRRTRMRISTVVALVAAVFFSVASGQRWPIMYLAFAYTLGLCIFADQGRLIKTIRRPQVLAVSVFLGSLLAVLTIGQGRAATLGAAVGTVFRRIAGTDVRTFLRLMEYVDSLGLRFFGSTWLMDLEAFLPGATPTFSVWVHRTLYGSANTAPPTLLGSFYVNFGIVGVIMGFFIATRFASYLDTILYRRKTISSLDIATVAYAIMHLAVSVHTDFIPKLYGVVFVFALNVAVKLAASLLATFSRRAGVTRVSRRYAMSSDT